jgi:hypothetical protein
MARFGRGLRRTDSVGTLRLARLVVAAALVALGIWSFTTASSRISAGRDAQRAASELVNTQRVRAALTQADALATSAYLVGGLEPAAQRSGYEAALNEAATQLRRLQQSSDAAANNDTTDALDRVAAKLVTYSGLVEQARSNNRRGFPVGSAYQRQASALVALDNADDASMLTVLSDNADRARSDVNDAARRANGVGRSIALAVLTGLALLAAASWWLQRRSRRTVNIGVAVAAVVVLLAGLSARSSLRNANSSTTKAISTNLARADLLAQMRSAIFEARSAESLTLIQRGSGQAQEARFQGAINRARLAVAAFDYIGCPSCALPVDLSGYQSQHDEVRRLDDDGSWDDAVALTLNTASLNGGGTQINQLNESTGTALDEQSQAATAALSNSTDALSSARWVLLGGFIVAAIASFIGIGRRLAEYR